MMVVAYVFALVAVGAMGRLAHLLLLGVPIDNLTFWIAGAIASALLAMGITFGAIVMRAGAAGSQALGNTWFPLFIGAMPGVGAFIALWGAIKLLIHDELSSCTITINSSTTHYDTYPLDGTGRPGGIVLVAVALFNAVSVCGG